MQEMKRAFDLVKGNPAGNATVNENESQRKKQKVGDSARIHSTGGAKKRNKSARRCCAPHCWQSLLLQPLEVVADQGLFFQTVF